MDRRTFIKTAAIVAAGTSLLGTPSTGFALPKSESLGFDLPKLPYAYNALEPAIDTQTMEIHHSKHHGGYVKNLVSAIAELPAAQKKDVESLMAGLNNLPEAIQTAVRNNGGGHYNHSLFWESLSPQKQTLPKKLEQALVRNFGSIEAFREAFAKAAATRFGSGWAWLVQLPDNKLVVSSTPNQDNPLMPIADVQGKPLLGLDVWEHAYYLKYQNRRADYIAAFWDIIHWEKVAQRMG
jgi:Fe-Mn family superoxide dismutase